MTAHVSTPEDLVLHGPRVLGFASAARISRRYGLADDVVRELLLDFEAAGWVQHSRFADSAGWHLTEAGRVEDERRLARELDETGTRGAVTAAHRRFLPLNRRFGTACTRWQVRPDRLDPMAFNDHSDWGWDEAVLRTMEALGRDLRAVVAQVAQRLQRFDGYADRYSAALRRVNDGQRRWVDAPDADSCHTVWIQLHEDLLATLGIPRGSDG